MNLMNDPISTHIFMLFFFLAVMLLNLYFVSTQKSFISLAKKLKFMTPLYHFSNAVVVYTGAIVAAYFQMFNYQILAMIIISIFLMVIEIKRYKKQRMIKSTDTKLQEEFYVFAKKIYFIEIIVLISSYILFKAI